jgi:hypothetical protein
VAGFYGQGNPVLVRHQFPQQSLQRYLVEGVVGLAVLGEVVRTHVITREVIVNREPEQ